MATNYVDNKLLYESLVKYQQKQANALNEGKERPRIPEYVGSCILLIAQRMSLIYKFSNYQYREDMIMDGVTDCLKYIDNFDSEKYRNPFSYFSQIIYFAFLRRIQGEKKHLYLKYALQQNNEKIDNGTVFDSGDTSKGKIYNDSSFLDQEKMTNFINDFESYMNKGKTKK